MNYSKFALDEAVIRDSHPHPENIIRNQRALLAGNYPVHNKHLLHKQLAELQPGTLSALLKVLRAHRQAAKPIYPPLFTDKYRRVLNLLSDKTEKPVLSHFVPNPDGTKERVYINMQRHAYHHAIASIMDEVVCPVAPHVEAFYPHDFNVDMLRRFMHDVDPGVAFIYLIQGGWVEYNTQLSDVVPPEHRRVWHPDFCKEVEDRSLPAAVINRWGKAMWNRLREYTGQPWVDKQTGGSRKIRSEFLKDVYRLKYDDRLLKLAAQRCESLDELAHCMYIHSVVQKLLDEPEYANHAYRPTNDQQWIEVGRLFYAMVVSYNEYNGKPSSKVGHEHSYVVDVFDMCVKSDAAWPTKTRRKAIIEYHDELVTRARLKDNKIYPVSTWWGADDLSFTYIDPDDNAEYVFTASPIVDSIGAWNAAKLGSNCIYGSYAHRMQRNIFVIVLLSGTYKGIFIQAQPGFNFHDGNATFDQHHTYPRKEDTVAIDRWTRTLHSQLIAEINRRWSENNHLLNDKLGHDLTQQNDADDDF